MGIPLPPSIQAALERLRRSARGELPGALGELRARFAEETLYVLALETSARCDSLGLLAASEEDLARQGGAGRWSPRRWSLRLRSLSALAETNESLDVVHGLARREGCPDLSAGLRALFGELLEGLRESGYCRPFGEPLLVVLASDEPQDAWRASARALNPPYLAASIDAEDSGEEREDLGEEWEDSGEAWA